MRNKQYGLIFKLFSHTVLSPTQGNLGMNKFDVACSALLPEIPRERYEFLCTKVREIINVLTSKFEIKTSEWKLYLGSEVAQIHHDSHTWCFCDYDAMIKEINESKKPVYLGDISGWKVSQNNDLQPNEVVISCIDSTGITRRAKLLIENKIQCFGCKDFFYKKDIRRHNPEETLCKDCVKKNLKLDSSCDEDGNFIGRST